MPPEAQLEVYEETARSIISSNESPDVGFSHSVNPYRGCFHACSYCYARPTHQYLDFGAGTDFERKIVVKKNAPELLEKEFMKPSWKGEPLAFSGVTDCYQPLEGAYELTRRCLQVCLRFRNPVSIITKGALIARDVDVLSELAKVTDVKVYFSVAFCDDAMSKAIEPNAPRPSTRFRAMKTLHDAHVPLAVGIAPVIPGLNDSQIPTILERAHECGARNAFMTLLRLPAEVKDVFLSRLQETYPTRYDKIVHGIQHMKGGTLNRSEFGQRMRGDGPEWEAVKWLYKSSCECFGFNKADESTAAVDELRTRQTTFRRPTEQLRLL